MMRRSMQLCRIEKHRLEAEVGAELTLLKMERAQFHHKRVVLMS